MNLKNGALSTEIEYYRDIKKILKAFQNIAAILKISSIDFSLFLFSFVGLLGFVVVAFLFPVLL